MQEALHRHCRLLVLCMLLPGLLMAGCGGAGDDGTSHVMSSAASIAPPQQVSSGSSRLTAHDSSSKKTLSPAPTVTDDTTAIALNSAGLAQLSALPHLSKLTAREKAGLFLLLPDKSSSQRLMLIEMYPSLSRLPVQQKQVLLDRLEKIVPLADNKR